MEKAYLGVDCGSVSLKLALIDEKKNLIDSVYLRNKGIIETSKKGLEKIANDKYEILGVGTTGSGRKFLGILLNSDIVRAETIAHTIGTLNYYPDARTVMDIGGEDSKLMIIREGIMEDFVLNNICGAGTGSVIDAIAYRLGIKIEDVGDIALKYKQSLDFPSKCGIFNQSRVVDKQNKGARKEDILMGSIRALVSCYLTMAKNIGLEPPYIYQGATAKNKAIVRAFEEQLEHKVIVPEYCDVMGAIGIALLVMGEGIEKTKFKGFGITDYDFETKIRYCEDCENNCELNEIYENNKLIGVLGSRCGKYP